MVLRNEPLQRTAWSKPHVCEELYREGGELVYIVWGRVYTAEHYKRNREKDEEFARARAETRVRNPDVYVRGHVRHSDHATVHLKGWHRVYINGELTGQTSVAFLD